MPKFDEVKDKVREVVIKDRARELSRKKATDLAARLKGATDFAAAAKAAGVEAKTTEFLTRDQPVPDLGEAPGVLEAAFKLNNGGVTEPIATDNGTAIVKVVEKTLVTPEDFNAQKDTFRDQLLADRRARFFSAYMQKAKEKMKIEVNREALQRVIG